MSEFPDEELRKLLLEWEDIASQATVVAFKDIPGHASDFEVRKNADELAWLLRSFRAAVENRMGYAKP